MKKDKIVLFSSGDFGIPTFNRLLFDGYELVGVVTSNDKVSYQSHKLSELCEITGTPFYVVKTKTIGNDEGLIKFLDDMDADLYCVISFKKLPSEIVSKAKKCSFNVHASLLPFFRGAAPITNAIRMGFKETGLTAFVLTDKIDCGPIIANKKMTIEENEDYDSLFKRLSLTCCDFTKKVVDVLSKEDWKSNLIEQPSFDFASFNMHKEILTAPKIEYADFWRIPWRNVYSFTEVVNLFNSLPSIPAQIVVKDKITDKTLKCVQIKIHKISNIKHMFLNEYELATETDGKTYLRLNFDEGSFDIERIQVIGKKEMDIHLFLNGFRHFNYENYKVTIEDISIGF